jgi:hypothetical protein
VCVRACVRACVPASTSTLAAMYVGFYFIEFDHLSSIFFHPVLCLLLTAVGKIIQGVFMVIQ